MSAPAQPGLQHGDEGDAVLDVQARLVALGYPIAAAERGGFGPQTESAVKAFQIRRGLNPDGIIERHTWRELVESGWTLGSRMLYLRRPMMRGDDVRELQRRLNRLGFDAGYDDGIYGPQTAAAVREFQLNVGLPDDGITGPDTVAALKALHRQHQEAPAFAVRERESLRGGGRPSLAGARVLVDPARGPADPGLEGPGGVHEQEITWAIANRLAGRLSVLGIRVVLSRGPGTTPTPSERAALANRAEVEAILSVALNGLPSSEARGAAAYYFGQDRYVSERGRALARLAVDSVVVRTGTTDCRTHPSTSALLRESRAPAVIVEPGFLTHPEEGAALVRPDHHALLAGALADAVVSFLLGGLPTGEPRTPVPAVLAG